MSSRYLTNSRVTRDFRHLIKGPFFRQRDRFPTKLQTKPNYPKPQDRIKYWNIVPGDFVRVVRGAHTSDERHEVLSIDKLRNLVNLRDITINRGHGSEAARVSRPIHYSNLQLWIGDYEFPGKDGGEPKTVPVFATRLSTSTPVYIPAAHRWFWRRYAAKTSPQTPTEPGIAPRKNRREISWPKYMRRTLPNVEFDYDTSASAVREVTWVPADLSRFTRFPPYFHIPAPTSQQRISPEQKSLAGRARAVQDAYIRGETDASVPMEQYLARELANPHSRAKKQERWQAAREEADRLRVRFMKAAKEARSLGGSVTTVGLNLTKKQAAKEGLYMFEAHASEQKKARQTERASQRGATEKLARKKARSARKALKRKQALRNLVLEPARNQALPPRLSPTTA